MSALVIPHFHRNFRVHPIDAANTKGYIDVATSRISKPGRHIRNRY
jgi:hypothetical protein